MQQDYRRRIVDDQLDELAASLPAIALEGPKAVGKTWTALQRARTVYRLDDERELELLTAGRDRLTHGEPPILVDEWQRYPASWDLVRRAVDENYRPNRFLLTGSAAPLGHPTHSGAGRIATVRMRPLSVAERDLEQPTVSVGALLSGDRARLDGDTEVDLERYVEEILRSGFPGVRVLRGDGLHTQLESYVDRIVEKDFEELGRTVRRPGTLRRWMTAYAAATASVASWETIRDAASAGSATKPSRTTTAPYRDVLEHLFVLDDLPAWLPTPNHLGELAQSPKHHLADPALAAVLVGASRESLLCGAGPAPVVPRDGSFLGALFESLAALSVRVYAHAAGARVGHLRVHRGEHEVDLVVERADGRVVAIEVKLSETVEERHLKHLHWLRARLGDGLLDSLVVTTGQHAYRRPDGIAVVPLSLLGP